MALIGPFRVQKSKVNHLSLLNEPPRSGFPVNRLREHITLGQFAFHFPQHFQLFLLFQAFGHHVHADAFRQRDNRVYDTLTSIYRVL